MVAMYRLTVAGFLPAFTSCSMKARRARLELKSTERVAADQKQAQDIRSHVLTLREGELDSRLRDRERTVNALEEQLRALTLLLRKGETTRDAQARRILALEEQLSAKAKESKKPRRPPPEGRPRDAPPPKGAI
jgi:hypothetical protein